MAGDELELSAITVRPQDRETFDEAALRELAGSIAALGQLAPLIVTRDGADVVLVAGERRYRALKLLGRQTALVQWCDVDAASEIQLAENTARRDLRPMEEARAMAARVSQGWTVERVAAVSGRSAGTVRDRLALATLGPELAALVDQGDLAQRWALCAVGLDANRQRIAARARVESESLTLPAWRALCVKLRADQDQDQLFAFQVETYNVAGELEAIATEQTLAEQVAAAAAAIVGPQEVADRLGVKVTTVHQWRRRDVLPPAVVVSGVPLWTWGQIAEWAKQTGRKAA